MTDPDPHEHPRALERAHGALRALLAARGITPRHLPLTVMRGDAGPHLAVLVGTNNPQHRDGTHTVLLGDIAEHCRRELGHVPGPDALQRIVLDTLCHEAVHALVRQAEDDGLEDTLELAQAVPWADDPASEDDRPEDDPDEALAEALGLHVSGRAPRAHPWAETLLQTFARERGDTLAFWDGVDAALDTP